MTKEEKRELKTHTRIYLDNLKPCPFCGCNEHSKYTQSVSVNRRWKDATEIWGHPFVGGLVYTVECGFCGAKANSFFREFADFTESEFMCTEEEAVQIAAERWNERNLNKYEEYQERAREMLAQIHAMEESQS